MTLTTRTTTRRTPSRAGRRQHGFSLTELLIAVTVLGVISAVAVPGYQGYTQKSRRATAHAALNDAASRQEQFFLDNKTYTVTVGSGGLNRSASAEGGYYLVSVDAATGGCPINRCYVLRATPQGSQAGDDCGDLLLNSDGNKTPAGCW